MNDFSTQSDEMTTEVPLLVEPDIYVEVDEDVPSTVVMPSEESETLMESDSLTEGNDAPPTEEALKKKVIKSGLIWGAVGFVTLGPFGALAGGCIGARVTKKRLQKTHKHNVTIQIL
jgi:hypothetical protein